MFLVLRKCPLHHSFFESLPFLTCSRHPPLYISPPSDCVPFHTHALICAVEDKHNIESQTGRCSHLRGVMVLVSAVYISIHLMMRSGTWARTAGRTVWPRALALRASAGDLQLPDLCAKGPRSRGWTGFAWGGVIPPDRLQESAEPKPRLDSD